MRCRLPAKKKRREQVSMTLTIDTNTKTCMHDGRHEEGVVIVLLMLGVESWKVRRKNVLGEEEKEERVDGGSLI